jgi:hypothetical protein
VGGQGGTGIGALGGQPNGAIGLFLNGKAGADGAPGTGVGGGLVQSPTTAVVIKNTTITGNTASTANSDVLIGAIPLVRSAFRK